RVLWWRNVLESTIGTRKLLKELDDYEEVSTFEAILPDSFEEYFTGVKVTIADEKSSPDRVFERELRKHIRGGMLNDPIRNRQVPRAQMKGVPFFLCGGG